MHIDFAASARSTVGIEWELALVDADTLELTPLAQPLLDQVEGGEQGPLRQEFLKNMIELVSGVHETVESAVGDLDETLSVADRLARQLGARLLGSGTHPFSLSRAQQPFDKPRYNVVVDRNQWWSRQLAICGTHIHVGIDHRDKALPITNGLARFFPYLLSLSASSPFWESEDTGYASQRTMLFQQLPTNGLPYAMETWAEFEAYAEELSEVGMITVAKEIRWDVRPSPHFGTVENRTLDSVPTLAEIGSLTALTQCLTEWMSRELDAGRTVPTLPPWLVKENKWRAARYGLEADIITPNPAQRVRPLRQGFEVWLERLTPIARQLHCEPELRFIETILADGPSYQRQRDVAAAHDGDLRAVVASLLAETEAGTPLPHPGPAAA